MFSVSKYCKVLNVISDEGKYDEYAWFFFIAEKSNEWNQSRKLLTKQLQIVSSKCIQKFWGNILILIFFHQHQIHNPSNSFLVDYNCFFNVPNIIFAAISKNCYKTLLEKVITQLVLDNVHLHFQFSILNFFFSENP